MTFEKDDSLISKGLGIEPNFPDEDGYWVAIEKYSPSGSLSSDDDDGDWDDDLNLVHFAPWSCVPRKNYCFQNGRGLEPKSQIHNFLDLLDGKYQDLAKAGVDRQDITIWPYYE